MTIELLHQSSHLGIIIQLVDMVRKHRNQLKESAYLVQGGLAFFRAKKHELGGRAGLCSRKRVQLPKHRVFLEAMLAPISSWEVPNVRSWFASFSRPQHA